MKRLIVAIFAAALCGCAAQQSVSVKNDWRVGTDQTPYRSISPVIVCDDCKF